MIQDFCFYRQQFHQNLSISVPFRKSRRKTTADLSTFRENRIYRQKQRENLSRKRKTADPRQIPLLSCREFLKSNSIDKKVASLEATLD